MGLLDWFRPKWKHPNKWVRRKAIAALVHEKSLVEVTMRDPDEELRLLAVSRLRSPERLHAVAKGVRDSEWKTGISALKEVHDINAVLDIARCAKSRTVRAEAVRTLGRRVDLSSFATTDSDPWVRTAAVQQIEDRAVLAHVAESDVNSDVRKTALGVLKGILEAEKRRRDEAQEATRRRDVSSRLETGLADEAELGKIAKTDPSEQMRLKAVQGLQSQDELLHIAIHEGSQAVAHAALSRVTAEEHVAEIALRARNQETCKSAIERIHDDTMLVRLATGHAEEAVRGSAAAHLLAAIEKDPDRIESFLAFCRTGPPEKAFERLVKSAWFNYGALSRMLQPKGGIDAPYAAFLGFALQRYTEYSHIAFRQRAVLRSVVSALAESGAVGEDVLADILLDRTITFIVYEEVGTALARIPNPSPKVRAALREDELRSRERDAHDRGKWGV